MTRTRGWGIAMMAAGLLAGCAGLRAAVDPPRLDGTAWALSALDERPPLAGTSATLRFDGDRVSGSDGCNRFSGRWTVQADRLAVLPPLASTQMACRPEVAAQAGAIVGALTGQPRARVADGRLVLLGPDGARMAVYLPQPRGLAGTSWRATGINDGRSAVRSLVAGTEVTLDVAPDGTAGGSAGCNRYTTRVQGDGERVGFAPVGATRRACTTPEGVMAQEQAFLAALATVTTARVDGDRLELRTASGALAVAFQRATGG